MASLHAADDTTTFLHAVDGWHERERERGVRGGLMQFCRRAGERRRKRTHVIVRDERASKFLGECDTVRHTMVSRADTRSPMKMKDER